MERLDISHSQQFKNNVHHTVLFTINNLKVKELKDCCRNFLQNGEKNYVGCIVNGLIKKIL